jgi:peptidoglycan/LPS O-acetylase OafA/YrhL
MAIGGIGAYLVISDNRKILNILYRKDLQWAVYIITILMLALNFSVRFISYEFYSLFFCFIIINLATNPNSVVKLDYKWLNYLGRISYGMYLYSGILRIFCIVIAEKIFGSGKMTWQMNLFYYFIAFASTILVSIVSYEFFEKPFLRAKNRYEVVKTEV